ncbi:MAG: isopentenyl phosphate kinase [Candidatus Thorarchaeota archaeon]
MTILKLGGSVITFKGSSPPKCDMDSLSRIAAEIKSTNNSILIVLGGGSFGHQAAHDFGYGDVNTPRETRLAGIPAIRHNMTLLSLQVEKIMNTEGIKSVVISPFSFVELENGEITEFPLKVIKKTIESGITVITHGDVCFDTSLGSSILSGDTIVTYIAQKLEPTQILLGTNVDGVFSDNPITNPEAKVIPIINSRNAEFALSGAGPSNSTDVTGGMAKKIGDLLKIKANEPEIVIFNLTIPGRLTSLLSGEPIICTRIQN